METLWQWLTEISPALRGVRIEFGEDCSLTRKHHLEPVRPSDGPQVAAAKAAAAARRKILTTVQTK